MGNEKELENFDEAIYTCPICRGEGGTEYYSSGGEHYLTCGLCHGSGFIDWVTNVFYGGKRK